MRVTTRFSLLLIAAAFGLSACSRNMDSNTYTSSSSVGKVVYGTVVSARGITIKDKENLSDNVLGGAAGGVMGGVAGSAIGSGSGQSAATVGGVIAGAVLGAMLEDELSTSSGFEYIVQLDAPKKPNTTASRSNDRISVTRGKSVESDVMDAAIPNETASDAVSVIQQDDVMIAPGTRVMVVYRDDRTRIIPAAR